MIRKGTGHSVVLVPTGGQFAQQKDENVVFFSVFIDHQVRMVGGANTRGISRGRAMKTNKKTSPSKRNRGRPKKEPSDESEEEDEEVKTTPNLKRRKSRKPRKPVHRNRIYASSSDDNEGVAAVTANRQRNSLRPSRFSAAQASKRLTKLSRADSDKDSDDDDDDAATPLRIYRGKRRKGNKKDEASSDEEFLADSASEVSIEEASFDSDSDDDNSFLVDQQVKEEDRAINIDNDDIGTADESSDEGEKVKHPKDATNDDVGTVDSSSDERGKVKAEDKTNGWGTKEEIFPENFRLHGSESSDDSDPDHAPFCPSTEDCITAEPLPKIHVCYISPDGSSRQCFALQTLRTIALKSSMLHTCMRVDLEEERMTFLQPPHFRTAMVDDLVDQIACRFGRDALDLHGSFYNRKPLDDTGSDDASSPCGGTQDDEEELLHRVQRYMGSQMGSRDIYSCPLCYSEMHRRVYRSFQIKSDDESSDEETKERVPSENAYDPMLILGWLDNEEFEGASAFCFNKISEVKKHLRQDHNVDTRGIEGNDLYMRYRVRAPDGLLQRYLKQSRRGFGNFQGDMRRYWNEGNSQHFIYLLELMQRANHCRKILHDNRSDDDEKEEAENFLSTGQNFFASMVDQAKEEWKLISSPFLKATKTDLTDFLVPDGSNEEEDENDENNGTTAFLAHRQIMKSDDESDENDLIHKIQRKYAENHENDSSSEVHVSDANDNVFESDSDNDDSEINGYYSEVEEEKDEWFTNILRKRKARERNRKTVGHIKTPIQKGKKFTKRKNTQSLTTTPSSTVSRVTPASKRRVIHCESDEE